MKLILKDLNLTDELRHTLHIYMYWQGIRLSVQHRRTTVEHKANQSSVALVILLRWHLNISYVLSYCLDLQEVRKCSALIFCNISALWLEPSAFRSTIYLLLNNLSLAEQSIYCSTIVEQSIYLANPAMWVGICPHTLWCFLFLKVFHIKRLVTEQIDLV